MKKILSVLLACTLLFGCVFAFASCGKTLSGTYEADLVFAEVSYTFKGNKVSLKVDPIAGNDIVLNGTYEITEDEAGNSAITITFEDNSSEEAKEYGGTLAFAEGEENGEKYIKIGLIKYEEED